MTVSGGSTVSYSGIRIRKNLWTTPLYKLYRYVPPYRVGFLHGFGLKTGRHYCPFWSGIGYGF